MDKFENPALRSSLFDRLEVLMWRDAPGAKNRDPEKYIVEHEEPALIRELYSRAKRLHRAARFQPGRSGPISKPVNLVWDKRRRAGTLEFMDRKVEQACQGEVQDCKHQHQIWLPLLRTKRSAASDLDPDPGAFGARIQGREDAAMVADGQRGVDGTAREREALKNAACRVV
ncbi:Hypothetical Protein FCC1311_016922 [Hondaea fermentalgiana]|uniref:Uncharacterized protein n=1 Tax=Hondaea fermentalgiana TaxID=2315210 RepID=A0A2R5GA95_9STRA|nr:Hypothetical Protein FCC1311_016922 [Hondaea fermentalgiana]|eukprot:GBG25473.1 Hypothetical Protein FCC1311_016922 [Hondaea fermentalgiana]